MKCAERFLFQVKQKSRREKIWIKYKIVELNVFLVLGFPFVPFLTGVI